jgi:hypothetical protein
VKKDNLTLSVMAVVLVTIFGIVPYSWPPSISIHTFTVLSFTLASLLFIVSWRAGILAQPPRQTKNNVDRHV